jgi:hypothetical protein
MRTAIAMLVVALLPATAFAAGTIGIYFTYNPGQMVYSPGPVEMFDGYIYLHNAQCMFRCVELKIEVPPGIGIAGYILPEGALLDRNRWKQFYLCIGGERYFSGIQPPVHPPPVGG